MTTLSIECAHCGTTLEIPTGSALLDLDDTEAHVDTAGTVSWICDTCEDIATQSVTWRTLLLLVTAGAHLFDEQDDERPTHPEAPPAGPPLTADDLLDIHTLLDDPTWFAQLETAALPPTASIP